MHISDVGMTGNLLRWSSTYECSDKHFLYIFSSPVFKILAVFMLEISINNCSRQLYLVFSLSTNRWYFLPDHVISNCVTRSSTSRLYAIKRLVHNLSFTLHVTLPLPVPSPLTLRARATAFRPARQPKRYNHRHTGHETEDWVVVINYSYLIAFTVTVKPRSYRSKIPVAVLVSTQLALSVVLNGVTSQVVFMFVFL